MTNAEIGAKTGDTEAFIGRCITRSNVPREVLDKLGIKTRSPRGSAPAKASIPAGGTIYACYVGASEKDAFLAFCSAMHISAKDMI